MENMTQTQPEVRIEPRDSGAVRQGLYQLGHICSGRITSGHGQTHWISTSSGENASLKSMGRNHQTMSTPAIEKTTDDIVTTVNGPCSPTDGTYRSSRVRGIRRKTIGNVGFNVGSERWPDLRASAERRKQTNRRCRFPREHQTKGGKLESLNVLLAVTVTSMLWVPVNLCR